jgi:Coenzyme PQQ synthesis protein D (PqqD)
MPSDSEPIQLDCTLVASADQLSSDVNSEAVILDLKSGIYFGLNQVGARVWELLQEPRTVAEIRDQLLDAFDVEPQRCERELLDLLEHLRAERLVEVRHGAA